MTYKENWCLIFCALKFHFYFCGKSRPKEQIKMNGSMDLTFSTDAAGFRFLSHDDSTENESI